MPSIVINSFPQTISSDAFNVDVTINGAKSGTNYLRIELFKDGTNNYFGETFNNKDWYGGTDGLSYLPVEIKSASTSAMIQGRIDNSNNYLGPGNYDLKIKRYTQSGNAADDSEQNVVVNINYVLQTPSISPSAVTQTQTPVATILDTIIPTTIPEEVILKTNPPEILADETQKQISNTPIPSIESVQEIPKNNFPFFAASIFAIGLFLIGMGAYLIYTKIHVR
ncbi:MAG TPA: hypothetical protein VG895_03425 [Patescibacteria group bacterium]|nr:hypothetical protein [Patescibacteria group bacterium]